MSPEGWMADPNTQQMDIYSLGIIFYEILTSHRPFNGPKEREYRDQHLHTLIPTPSVIRADVPVGVSDIIQKMTAKRPQDRYPDADEVLIALETVLHSDKNKSINIEAILRNAQTRTRLETEEVLSKLKREEEWNDANRILNFSIGQLFQEFETVTDEINRHSQNEKITYSPFLIASNAYASTLRLTYFGNTVTVSFYNVSMSNYRNDRRKRDREWQQANHGMIIQEYQPDYIEKDKVVLVGSVATSHLLPSGFNLGWNIVLLKESDADLYGYWRVCKFRDTVRFANVAPSEFYYYIDSPKFFEQYDFGRGNVSNVRDMTFTKLSTEDIIDLLSKLPNLR
jgi:serine/threonine protein kinase